MSIPTNPHYIECDAKPIAMSPVMLCREQEAPFSKEPHTANRLILMTALDMMAYEVGAHELSRS